MPSAQEVCYQRIQLAQQQATQLAQPPPPPPSLQLSTASHKSSLALHKGLKKRIAHVPNTAFPTVSKCSKQAPLLLFNRYILPLGFTTVAIESVF